MKAYPLGHVLMKQSTAAENWDGDVASQLKGSGAGIEGEGTTETLHLPFSTSTLPFGLHQILGFYR